MNSKQAWKIINNYFQNDYPTKDDEFLYIEASKYIIEADTSIEAIQRKDDIACYLAGYYYSKKKYDLAEKYYLIADELGNQYASDGLGYIYFYGRNGSVDYKKAFYYYSKAAKFGNDEAKMKIADMYHHGYGVDKDENKYKKMIIDLYKKLDKISNPFTFFYNDTCFPEVAHRLASIYIDEGHPNDCIEMLKKAKDCIAQRLNSCEAFWGNLIVCKTIICVIYKVIEFDKNNFDLLDLFYVLSYEHRVKLIFNENIYQIESKFDEGDMRIICNGKSFKNDIEFYQQVLIENKHIYMIDLKGIKYKAILED